MIFSVALTLAIIFNTPAPAIVFIGGVIGAIMHPDALDLGQRSYCEDQGYVPEELDEIAERLLRANFF